MSIVLNEYVWAENALNEKQLGKRPSETLCRIAKYYLKNGMSKKETRAALEKFILECDPNMSLVKWSDSLDKTMKYAAKYPLIMVDEIRITKKEIDPVRSIRAKQLQRLAFTLLCIAKYSFAVYGNDSGWVSTPDKEIMNMANINTSVKRQCLMFGQLRDLGLIRFSKQIDNLSVQVLYMDTENDDAEIIVNDFRNLGYQYMKYCGGSFFVCECCGITERTEKYSTGRRKMYCDECARKIYLKKTVESVMRKRINTETLDRI